MLLLLLMLFKSLEVSECEDKL